ncbi:peptidyl-prolyl cis-trans isomerase CYP59-like isoform X3 [Lycium barbarum]|uniref:peptidyl-prolyl cis-trans isomerase CYP59-like isoform X3 n=1 Tax=Lycium barbarum TaxID=112863 RepID=UPI00293F0E6A|nr:peptidyl-prolyl cis-trans isomerase CYP59-like isoform X3 [Lycium barbarum]
MLLLSRALYPKVVGGIAGGKLQSELDNEAYLDENRRPFKNMQFFVNLSESKHTGILDDPFDDLSQRADLIQNASPEGNPKDEPNGRRDVCFTQCGNSSWNTCFSMPSPAAIRVRAHSL